MGCCGVSLAIQATIPRGKVLSIQTIPSCATGQIKKADDISVDFPANKLKSGAGETALYVLDVLADAALIHTNFQWKKMIPPEREEEDVAVDQDEEEDNESEVGFLFPREMRLRLIDAEEDYIDEDDGVFVDLSAPLNNDPKESSIQAVLHSNTDVVEWRQEVERVTPLLKITIRQDAKRLREKKAAVIPRIRLATMTNVEETLRDATDPITRAARFELGTTMPGRRWVDKQP
ncbi:unnamed protein product [Heligmosomoides polygyrus]|uniref:Upf2 domain-containing protein n=1 Tax=Heligmosomoides polygyrus TaxID=6339 RepID=A0A3P8A767_HELPZ|nr:unnamed protein product [Heligmosomoides polygyrus]